MVSSRLSSSNEVATDARQVSIVDEGLGIEPAVEFGGVAVPFHQSLLSSAHLGTLQYRFHAVEGSVQHFTEVVNQSVHGRIGGMNLVYGEHLFAPIRHVAFFELTLVLTDAHAIR